MRTVRRSGILVAALAGLLPSCREAVARPGSHPASGAAASPASRDASRSDALATARARVLEVEAHRGAPLSDREVEALAAEGHADAFTLAARMLIARWQRDRSARDVQRGDDYLQAAIALAPEGAVGCDARRRAIALALDSQNVRSLPRQQREYASRCGALPAALAGPVSTPPPRVAAAPPRLPLGRYRRVVIDPGHGGSDPGAIGPGGLRESAVTLDVARRVAERLATRYGVQVVLTRDRDVYVDLEARAAHANEAGADAFVSIHCNAARNPDARGISTFVLQHDDARVAARVVAREGELIDVEGARDTWDVTHILADLRLSQHGRDSLGLAREVQGAMLHDARLLYPQVDDMGVHPARFHVLVTARMPAVLVELSFISHALEERRLGAEAYRDVLASAIARALAEHR